MRSLILSFVLLTLVILGIDITAQPTPVERQRGTVGAVDFASSGSPTAGIQEAIGDFGRNGGVVTIPSGEYLVGQSIYPGNMGSFAKWAKIEVVLAGPKLQGRRNPNPFAIIVDGIFTSPSGKEHRVPGFYDGDNNDVWPWVQQDGKAFTMDLSHTGGKT